MDSAYKIKRTREFKRVRARRHETRICARERYFSRRKNFAAADKLFGRRIEINDRVCAVADSVENRRAELVHGVFYRARIPIRARSRDADIRKQRHCNAEPLGSGGVFVFYQQLAAHSAPAGRAQYRARSVEENELSVIGEIGLVYPAAGRYIFRQKHCARTSASRFAYRRAVYFSAPPG